MYENLFSEMLGWQVGYKPVFPVLSFLFHFNPLFQSS